MRFSSLASIRIVDNIFVRTHADSLAG